MQVAFDSFKRHGLSSMLLVVLQESTAFAEELIFMYW